MSAGLPFAEILLKSTFLFCLGILAACVLRSRSSAERHLVLTLSVVGGLFLLPITLWNTHLPGVHLSVPAYSSAVGLISSTATPDVQPAPQRMQGSWQNAGPDTPAPGPQTSRTNWPMLLSLAYLAIALLIGLSFLIHHLRLGRRLRTFPAIGDPLVLHEVAEARFALGISRPVRALAGPAGTSPWTWGSTAPRGGTSRRFPKLVRSRQAQCADTRDGTRAPMGSPDVTGPAHGLRPVLGASCHLVHRRQGPRRGREGM